MKNFYRQLHEIANSQRMRREALAPQARALVFNLIERAPQSAAGRRVERILELMVMAEDYRVQIDRGRIEGRIKRDYVTHFNDPNSINSPLKGFQCYLPDFSFTDPAVEELNLKYREALRELQALLIRYRWRPTIEDRGYLSLGERLLWDRTSSANTEENVAIQYLLRQTDPRSGPVRILRFRKCCECKAWFYALKDHQCYCSEPCRKKFHSHSPKFRKRRAEYMKQYRIDDADREERAMRLVKESN